MCIFLWFVIRSHLMFPLNVPFEVSYIPYYFHSNPHFFLIVTKMMLVVFFHQIFLLETNFSFRSFSFIFHIIFIYFVNKTKLLLQNNNFVFRKDYGTWVIHNNSFYLYCAVTHKSPCYMCSFLKIISNLLVKHQF